MAPLFKRGAFCYNVIMKFIDEIKIKVKAGDGGNGCVSFRREKYVPRGGPDGGHGGDGGNIIFEGDNSKHTLFDLNYLHIYKAERGEHGRGKDQNGKNGQDLIIKVPLGTVIKNADNDEILADIIAHGQKEIVARGGKGGRGNMAFVTPTQRAPRYAEDGQKGEEFNLLLELKLIADVGIIGFPNAGKSTFISVVSAAKPKVADYPFTTLHPNLGVVKGKKIHSFVIADMPGLIEGAHEGVGLGIRFLKHMERTKLLVHFIDCSEDSSMIERYNIIRNEIKKYSMELFEKKEIIVSTKIDSANEKEIDLFRKFIENNNLSGNYVEISSITRKNTEKLIELIEEKLLAYNNEKAI
ncbi:MAG: GTPase [Deferribacteres bacterium]|nr:GTPase [Deferribacteres bacterium]